jgi:hypothetical protein
MLGKEELLEDFPLSAFSGGHPTKNAMSKAVCDFFYSLAPHLFSDAVSTASVRDNECLYRSQPA